MSDYFLADDLSGALDAAAAFHHAGRRVTIALSPDEWPETAADEVVGITTETRNVPAEAAAHGVAAALAHGQARGARLIYKKIDSTLRGQVAVEVAALAAAMPEAALLFAPANPRVGRTVRDGVLRVHGVPVAETEFAHDPASPVRESSIRVLLDGIASAQWVIADAETEADLAAAVARMELLGRTWVGIGSGALARPIAQRSARPQATATGSAALPPLGPILFVCGSANALNRRQAELLARERGVRLLVVSPREGGACVRAAIDEIQTKRAVALLIEAQRTDRAVALSAIAGAACAVINEAGVSRVFATGGETAFALCRELGIGHFHYQAEIEAGLGLARANAGTASMLWAVKPGGFGDERTWLRGLDALSVG